LRQDDFHELSGCLCPTCSPSDRQLARETDSRSSYFLAP
jgi:hypothetical protein